MLTARPSESYRRFFTWYFVRRARRFLSHVAIRGGDRLAGWDRDNLQTVPLVIIANHSSWWDAVLPIIISLHHHRHDAFGIMEESQLHRYGFFRKVGMFSIDRDNARSARHSLHYAAELLRGRNRVLWVFPQGEIVPNDRRPITCYPGTAHLLRLIGEVAVVPVAFRYELMDEERPAALISVGEIRRIVSDRVTSVDELNEGVSGMLVEEMDRLRDDVLERRLRDFRTIVSGQRSIDERWDRTRGIRHPG